MKIFWRQNYLYYILLLSIETCFNDVIFTKLQTDPYHEIRPTISSHDYFTPCNKKKGLINPFDFLKHISFPADSTKPSNVKFSFRTTHFLLHHFPDKSLFFPTYLITSCPLIRTPQVPERSEGTR